MQPRPYQSKAIESVWAGLGEFTKQLLVLPTGGGKTLLFSWLAKRVLPKRTLILAHREELVDQAIEKLHRATGIFAQKEKAEFEASLESNVVVASVQTMIRRLAKWPADHFGLVVADEAHHAISKSWQAVLQHFDKHSWVLGVTATPDRGDRKNLGQYFENVPSEVSLFELINQGYLSRIAVRSIPLKIDLKSVRQTAGDYNETDLGNALEPYLGEIARALSSEAAFRRTLVFLPLIATSKKFVEHCRNAGLNAEHIDGVSEDRKEKLARFARGDFEVLCNAMLLTEGFDDPGIDCVVILRPTRSRPLYSQMVGRGTRIAPGKKDLLLLDFLWLHEKHSLIRPAHLVAKSQEEADIITTLVETKGGGQDELDLEGLATEAQRQREEKLRQELADKARRKARFVDVMEFFMSIDSPEVLEYEPTMNWENAKVTDGQRRALEQSGVDPDWVKCRGHAMKIFEVLNRRRDLNLATPRQVKYLKRFHHHAPERATFKEASEFLDRRFAFRKEKAA